MLRQALLRFPSEILKTLDASARARGCSRSAEVIRLVLERGRGEDPVVTAARFKAEGEAHKRAAIERQAKSQEVKSANSVERARWIQIRDSGRVWERLALEAIRCGRPLPAPPPGFLVPQPDADSGPSTPAL